MNERPTQALHLSSLYQHIHCQHTQLIPTHPPSAHTTHAINFTNGYYNHTSLLIGWYIPSSVGYTCCHFWKSILSDFNEIWHICLASFKIFTSNAQRRQRYVITEQSICTVSQRKLCKIIFVRTSLTKITLQFFFLETRCILYKIQKFMASITESTLQIKTHLNYDN